MKKRVPILLLVGSCWMGCATAADESQRTRTALATDSWVHCAAEGERCVFSGTKKVRYGAAGQYATKTLTDGTDCNNGVFGDPLFGTRKNCEVASAGAALAEDRDTHNYLADTTTLFANPETGHVENFAHSGLATFPPPLADGASYLQDLRAKFGTSTVWVSYYLGDWKRTRLPQSTLDRITQDLATARSIGFKLIPHFHYAYAYQYEEPMVWSENELDATKDVIVDHAAQLKTVFSQNADVLAMIAWGMIGPWGEQWISGAGNVGTGYPGSVQPLPGQDGWGRANDNTRAILRAWLDNTPSDRMVNLNPDTKKDLFGATPLPSDQAFSGTDQARIGFENDCFLTDTSAPNPTYNSNTGRGPTSYLASEGLYLPQIAFPDPGCGYAATSEQFFNELDAGHWDFFGSSEDKALLLKIGYRYRLENTSIQNGVAPGNAFGLSVSLVNDNGGTLFNPRDVEIVLRSESSGQRYRLSVVGDTKGNRTFFPTAHGRTTWDIVGGVPASIPEGSYEVLLNLPDPYPSVRDRAQYSIRLANADTWESETGYNKLQHRLSVTRGATGNIYNGTNWFVAN